MASANRGDKRLVPETLPGMDVGEMDFDDRNLGGYDGVPNRQTSVSIGGGVENDRVIPASSFLDPVNELTLVIGLAEVDLDPKRLGPCPDHRLDLLQGRSAIDFRLPLPEEIQVRPVEE